MAKIDILKNLDVDENNGKLKKKPKIKSMEEMEKQEEVTERIKLNTKHLNSPNK